MAPEQLKGKPSDFRSDIYSLGVVLYEMATGKLAFDSVTPSVLIDDIVRRSPTPPRKLNPDLSPALERIILGCLAKDPARRYQGGSELSAALKLLESGSSVVPPIPKSHILRELGVATLVLLLATSIFWVWTRRTGLTPPRGEVARINELAILPLGTSSNDSETVAFGNGLVHTLTARLAQLTGTHSFLVVPASEMRAKGVSNLREASQEFGANLGLELNIERSGEMLRVNYALIDAKLHRQLQGDTITASMSDPFAIEDRVADSVVKALQIELQPEEQKAQSEHGTNHPVAYDYYLQGRGYLEDYTKIENIENAIVEFNHALRYDPNYSLAFSGLGEAYWQEYEHTKQIDWVRLAKFACDRAIRLRPNQAAGHLCLGLVNAGTGEYQKSVKEYNVAAQLDPTNDSAYSGLASAYEQLGEPKEAEETYRKAIGMRPSYWAGYNRLGAFYLRSGRYAEASDMFSQVIALAPDSFVGYSNLGISYLLRGDYAEASPALEHSIEIRPTAEASSNLGTAYFQVRRYSDAARIYEKAVILDSHNYEVWGNLADAYYWAPEERTKAKAAYQRALDLAIKSAAINPRDPSLLGFIADYYAMLGKREPALTYINKALRIAPKSADLLSTAALVFNQCGDTEEALSSLERAVAAGYSKTSLRDTPNFDNLRDQPRVRHYLTSTDPFTSGRSDEH
jgi:tetratricopeptide (TPR) repeat protein